MIDKQI